MKKYFPIFLILTLFTLYAGFQLGLLKLPLGITSTPSVIAHRGDSAHAPENTLGAFRLALQGGADGIELDVRKTKDHIPLVFHDANLKRIFADDHRLDEITEGELRKLSTSVGTTQEPPSVCTLEEVLRLCCEYPKAQINLDLKALGTEEKVVSLIEKYDLSGQCEITSKDAAVLQKIKKLNPEIRTILLISSSRDLSAYKYEDIVSLIQNESVRSSDTYADGISVHTSLVTASLVRHAHRRNQYIYAWTVNNAPEIRRMCHVGVDGIITDDPSFAAHCIYSDH